MDVINVCPICHLSVRPTDYFCSNCGRNLRPSPLSTALTVQTMLYIKSILLPPMGIIWGIRYLRQPDIKSKIVGIVSIVITITLLLLMIKWTINLIDTVNDAVNSSMNGMYGY
jgi:hypothetical protein